MGDGRAPGAPAFPVGGGDAGARIRARDWSGTPLGPPETWPPALRVAVNLILNAPESMFLGWGPELLCFYNDTYAPIFGPRLGIALGAPLPEIWRDAWDQVRPIADKALAGEASRYDDLPLTLARYGEPESTWWSFSYSPLRDETGAVVGIFSVAAETTGRVLAARRQAFRAALEAALHRHDDPDAFIAVAVQALGRHLGASRVGYGQVSADGETIALETRHVDGVASLTGSHPLSAFGADTVARQRRGLTIVLDDAAADASADWAAIETGAVVSVPLIRDGRLKAALFVNRREAHRWTEDEVTLIEDVAARIWDTVERARSEAASRASDEQFRVFAQAMPNQVWAGSGDGQLTWFNDQVYAYSGARAGELDGEAWGRLIHPDDLERVGHAWAEALRSGGVYETEFRIRRADGAYRWFLVRGEPIRAADGVVAQWIGANTDIHDQKRVAAELARLNETLERQVDDRTRERDRLWHNSQDILIVIDTRGVFRAVNPAVTRILGWAPEEMLDLTVFDFIIPEDHPSTIDALAHAATEQLPTFENRYRHKDGGHRWLSWVAAPEGALIYATARHITAEKAQAEALLKTEEALRQAQKMEAVGQLTGGVAHDFNNLLTVIKSSTDLLRRPNLPEERRDRYVEAISDTVARAAKLTGQLLAFARRQALQPEVFEVGDSIRSVSEMIGSLTGARIRIVVEAPDEPCNIDADPSQFDTAIVNMAVNARDAMDGEGVITIAVRPVSGVPARGAQEAMAGEYVAVSVSDTGAGIAEADLDRIFEPFFTTKGVGHGTGLGLSQVFGFARQSRGDVRVDSVLGLGATFTLYLPRVDRRGPPARAAETASAVDGGGLRVLVVEDNSDVGAFATQALAELGYATVWAANAREALIALDEGVERFDVVFSDVAMPGMNGIDLAREISRLHPGLPVVLTSGYSHVLAEDGTDGFQLLHKPYSIDELSRVIGTVAAAGRAFAAT